MKTLLALVLLAGACQPGAPAPAQLVPAAAPRTVRAVPEPGFIGVVVAGESVELAPRTEARVQELLVEPGQTVSKGTPLCRLDVRAAEHELAGARAALADASRRLGRRQRLARGRSGAVTIEELEGVRREVAQEKARVAQLSELRAEALVRAPFDGVLVETYLAPGALAGPGRPIGRLVGRGQPRVRFAVPEESAHRVGLGHLVDVRIGGADRPLRGRVTGLHPEIDSSSRMIYAAAALESVGVAAGLSTGAIARVFVAAGVQAVPEGPRP